MFANFQYILQHNCRIELNKPVLVGVSGGPDSLCLLDLFWQSGLSVVVAHLNHGLRLAADAEAEVVRREAEARKLQFIYQKIDVFEYAERQRISIEEAAREVRYRFLFEHARLTGAQAVAVGHTADDQVETVLMHLLRGTGLAGLRGMKYRAVPNNWNAIIPLIRPLLGFWRVDIQRYLDEHGIHAVLDESNLDVDYFRNRVRSELIPYLQKYNPKIKQALFRMADIVGNDYEVIENMVSSAWDECCVFKGNGYVGYDIGHLSEKPKGVLRQLIRRGIELIRDGLRDTDYDQIERAVDFIFTPTTTRTNLNEDVYLQREGQILWLALREAELPIFDLPQLAGDKGYVLDVPGVCHFAQGWVFSVELVELNSSVLKCLQANRDAYQAWVDADCLSLPLELRGRKPGDRFQPLGMTQGSIKISDFMINQKIPQRARDHYPLVVSGGEIIWIPGYRLGHKVRVTSDTKRIIHMSLARISIDG